MKRLLQRTLLGSGLLALGLSANAQVYRDDPYNRNDPYYRNDSYNRNDPYYRNGDYRNRSYGSYGGSIIDQAQADLDRAGSTSYLSGGQRRRIDHARQKLWEFQDRQQREGRFDTHKLDDAIDNIQHLVNSNGIRYRDRSMLEADLQRLREFRSYRNGDYRGYDPYYRR